MDQGDLVARMAPGGGGAWVRGECALVWVEGPDAGAFLQGVLTCDVATIAAGEARPGLLLDVKGRIRADLRVVRDGPDAFTLVTSPWLGADLAGALGSAMVSEDAEVLGPEASAVVSVFGADGPSVEADIVLPGLVPGSWDLVTPDPESLGRSLGLPEAPADLADAVRVAARVPIVGPDIAPGTTLVHEAGLEGVAVSFDKGCYLGQETVARVQYRGKVNRTLRLVALDGPAAPLAEITRGGAPVGRLGTAALHPRLGWIALAIVRREVAPDDLLTVGGTGARLSAQEA